MSRQQSWFRQGAIIQVLEPGDTIALENPQPTAWMIMELLNERQLQVEEEDVVKEGAPPSYASIKLACVESTEPSRRAMMRVYMQIPYLNTELEDSETRAKQASTFTPRDLLAYKTFSGIPGGATFTPELLGYKENQQDSSGLVPGGFITWFAWEIVPGPRLGDYSGDATGFWPLERAERDKIRQVFQKTLPYVRAVCPGTFVVLLPCRLCVWRWMDIVEAERGVQKNSMILVWSILCFATYAEPPRPGHH